MEQKRKRSGLILGAGIVLITGAALAVSALAGGQPKQENVPPASTAAPTAAPEAGDEAGMTANASAIGYGGPVLVRLTLDDQGRIAEMDVGGARFSETEGLGSRVKDEAFIRQFIGQTPPLALGEDVDAVSGATVSSEAVVDAVNEAAAFLTQKQEPSDTN